MKKTNTLIVVLILSIISGFYFYTKIFNSSNTFKDSFNELETPSELKLELEKGVYSLFELSTKLKSIEKPSINYLITERSKNPKILEIILDTINSKNKTITTYTIHDRIFKSIGQFEINKNQTVHIISKINDKRINKLAFRSKEKSKSFMGVLMFSFLLFASVGGIIISGIALLIIRKKTQT